MTVLTIVSASSANQRSQPADRSDLPTQNEMTFTRK